MEPENTHQNKKVIYTAIGLVVVIILVIILVMIVGNQEPKIEPVDNVAPLTAEEILIKQMTASEPSSLSPEEEEQISKEMTAAGKSKLTEKEISDLKEAMAAQ